MNRLRRTGDRANDDDAAADTDAVDWHAAWAAVREDLGGKDGYLVVFLLTLVALFLLQAGSDLPAGDLSALVATLMALTLALLRAHAPKAWTAIAVGSGILALTLSTLRVITGARGDELLTISGSALFAVFVLITLPAVLGAAFGHRRVTLNTMAATLTTFLLLGMLFALVLRTVDLATADQLFADITDPTMSDFVYFSFVTLTTLGYGDVVPATDLGRAIATLEAITGQVFLVTAVALSVSRLGQMRRPLAHLGEAPLAPASADTSEEDPAAGGGAGGATDH